MTTKNQGTGTDVLDHPQTDADWARREEADIQTSVKDVLEGNFDDQNLKARIAEDMAHEKSVDPTGASARDLAERGRAADDAAFMSTILGSTILGTGTVSDGPGPERLPEGGIPLDCDEEDL